MVDKVKKMSSSPAKLGQILLHGGFLTGEELAEGLAVQEYSKKLIGEILVKKGYIRKKDLIFGLTLQSILITATLTTTFSLAPFSDSNNAFAGSNASNFQVAVTVPKVTQISQVFQTSAITLTDADIGRGYIDIRSATRLIVKNNNKSGYVLLFEGLGQPFKEVLIYGLAYDCQIDSVAAFVHQPYSKKVVSAELSYRFILSKDAHAGEYPWPLSISLQPTF